MCSTAPRSEPGALVTGAAEVWGEDPDELHAPSTLAPTRPAPPASKVPSGNQM